MDKNTSWLDHPVKVAVMVAVVGSIILVIGQLFGTLFPIWLGPDLSDYNLVFVCNPVYMNISVDKNNSLYLMNRPTSFTNSHIPTMIAGLDSIYHRSQFI